MATPATLVLADGTVFKGVAVGHHGRAAATLVSFACVTGFPDVMTDPSYHDKMLLFTYPHIGNAGVGQADYQSDNVHAKAIICREVSAIKANRLGEMTFDEFLKKHEIPGIVGIDTRHIARIIYENGPQQAAVGCGKHADPKSLLAFLKEHDFAAPLKRDFATAKARMYNKLEDSGENPRRWKVAVYDFGVKRGFLRRLEKMGCEIKLLPHAATAKDALEESVDGVVFSAGPGIPSDEKKAIKTASEIIGKKPLWGIGVGAGILALAAGAEITVDGRGHYGEHGVGRRDEPSGEMTMQCHDFWLKQDSLSAAKLEMSHYHLNDKSVVGFESEELGMMATLFHPEAEPGPRDSLYLFERFEVMMQHRKKKWLGLI